jgi:hypothetical protein
MNPRFALLLALLMPQAGAAAEQRAHVHGIATLQVAVDGPTLTLNLSSPLDNLLGFEHAPRTTKEKAAATDLTTRLRQPDTLLVPTQAAGCAVASAKIDAPILEERPTASAQRAPGKGTATAAKAAAGQTKRDRGHGDDDEHAELSAEYVFRCRRPEALHGLDAKLFESFLRVRQIDVQVVGPKGQSAAKLTPAQRQVSW